jgi:hypothetical protein
MKGTILDFLNLAAEKPQLAKEFLELAAKHDFEFTDELNDEQLDDVAGGAAFSSTQQEVGEATLQDPLSALQDTQNELTAMMTMKSNMASRAHQTMMSIINNLR